MIAYGDLKTGDVVWAPYRRFPEWPALVRCVYPKKVTFTFLPISEDPNAKSSVFNCPPHKLRLLTGSEPLPAGAKKDMRDAYKAALEILKKNGLLREERQLSEELPLLKASEINKQSVLGELFEKTKKGSDVASNGDTASSGGASHVWNVGEVAWLNTPNHSEWPVVIRELKKKFAMVDAFPLKLNCKPERYPLSACHRFDLSGKNLEAAIKRERNYELRLALQSVLKYFKRREKVSNVEESDTEEDYGDSKVEVASDGDRQLAKTRGLGGLEEELESGDEDDDVDLLTTLKKGEGKRRGKRRLEKSSSPEFKKKQKFSEVVKDLETEINEKLDSLGKGDLAWINRARSGRIVKWPVVVCFFLVFLAPFRSRTSGQKAGLDV
ncbi:unnamed protein product [Gongylonema pulchrum]|uniref:PWWP domain-containing protein n=2 Tax=Gongylonema pulchrum TaxID=637853 RepID=A0A183DW81_9BILA|nr:unnamed protein product [Gongylonema pulchrum]